MSADLFAEFNKPAAPSQQQQKPTSSSNPSQHQPAQADPFGSFFQNSPNSSGIASFTSPTPTNTQLGQSWQQSQPASLNTARQDEDEDGWGDFEVAEPALATSIGNNLQNQMSGFTSATQTSNSQPSTLAFTTPNQPPDSLPTSTFSHSSIFEDDTFNYPKEPRLKVSANAHDPSVLFDANDFELDEGNDDDDTFGDFEDAPSSNIPSKGHAVTSAMPTAQSPSSAISPAMVDLLSLDDHLSNAAPVQTESFQPTPTLRFGALQKSSISASSEQSTSHKTYVQETRKQSPSRTVTSKPKKPAPQPSVANMDDDDDDDWAAWDDNTTTSPSTKPLPKTEHVSDPWAWEAQDQAAAPPTNDNTPPPVNVPPPSIILSVFSELFGLGEPLFKAVAGQSPERKKQILSSTKSAEFLQGYLLLASTAAKVIAGRKQRWLRDKILAKSMSISAAGSKGMKLAGVDKTQSAREDREAADVVSSWRLYVGKLRSAIAVVNSSTSTSLKVPELSDTMQVQTAKMVPTAPKPCIICGLKRDERVAKVDIDVEDSFGEWWVEHWGHRACKNFWIQHEKSLRQR